MTLIDAHQHVWERSRADYAWIPPGSALDRDFRQEDVAPSLAACGVDGTVLVQAADDPRDTQWMLRVADAHPEVVGVVGFLPLELPEIAAEALDELVTHPAFVGVRSLIHDRPDPRWLAGAQAAEGLALLEGAGVPFDLVADRPEHLALIPEIGERHPELDIVIDHLAKPPIGAWGPWRPRQWEELMAAAAENPRVHAKVSGLYAQGPDPSAWTEDSIRSVVDRAVGLFGADRLMYGGDWPVSTTAGGYERVYRGIAAALERLDEEDREAIRSGTAMRFYGIEVSAQDTIAADDFVRAEDGGTA